MNPDCSNAAPVGLSFFFVLGSLIQIVGILVSKPLADRFGKKAVFIAGMAITTIATALVFFVTPKDDEPDVRAGALSGPSGGGRRCRCCG